MQRFNLFIGMRFYNPTGHGQCADMGKRTITVIGLDAPDENQYVSPIYAVAKSVMDRDTLDI